MSTPVLLSARPMRAAQIAKYAWDSARNVRAIQRGGRGAQVAAERLVRDTADAGVLFVKMSQFVAGRGDMLDPATVEALAKLQDDVPCEPTPPTLPGYVVQPCPMASASIASVFKGVAPDGRAVVIKQVREGVRDRVATDLPLLVGVLRLAGKLNVAGAANLLEIVRECQPMIEAELDLRHEAKAQMMFRKKLGDVDWLRIPRVYEAGVDYMVSDFVPSRKVTSVPPDPFFARRLFELYVRMILDVGCVHADPHAGNIGVCRGGGFVMYDFGAVIDVRDARPSIATVLRSTVTDDVETGVRALVDMGIIQSDARTARRLRRSMPSLKALMDSDDVNADLAKLPEFADNKDRIFQLTTRYVYLVRSLVIVQGLITYHDPGFSLRDYAEDFEGLISELADVPAWDIARAFFEDVMGAPSSIKGVQSAVLDVSDAVDSVQSELPNLRVLVRALAAGVLVNLAILGVAVSK